MELNRERKRWWRLKKTSDLRTFERVKSDEASTTGREEHEQEKPQLK